MDKEELIRDILRLKQERDATIVAHNYQIDDVQELADIIGDSFALSKYCASSPQDIIVFCGVHFMAESAKILSPEKIVLLPEINAGCPMADMVDVGGLRAMKHNHPGAAVICYINTSAAVKAECDICCTSSNAVKVIQSMASKEIIFVPDKNLGDYIAKKVPEKRMTIWNGFCVTHHRVTAKEVKQVQKAHPDAFILVHPECKPEVVELADFVGSTKQIIDFATASHEKKFIIGTEMGVLYRLKKDNPEKTFYLLSPGLICPNMKKTNLESVYHALKEIRYKIEMSEEIIAKARLTLERMLKVS